jgi:hypothetical protein
MAFSEIFLGAPVTPYFEWGPTAFDWLPKGYSALTSSYLNSWNYDGIRPSWIEPFAELHAVRAFNAGGTLLVADGKIAYFEPRNSIDVAIWLKVGSHNDGADPEEVASLLQRTDKEFPLAAYFADDAGYKARFVSPISLEEARIIADRFSSISEGENIAEGFGLPLAEFIYASQSLQLWWD